MERPSSTKSPASCALANLPTNWARCQEPFSTPYGHQTCIGSESMEIMLETLERVHPYPHTGTNG
jgi:hypothetical protein